MTRNRSTNKHPAPQAKCAKILIVDDHPLIREGLRARIASQPDIKVCGEASSVDEGIALMRKSAPELIILDLALKRSHGLELIKRVRAEGCRNKILVVSAYPESLFAERALRAGADGYINKQALQSHMVEAIHTVLRGERYLSSAMSQRLMAQAIEGKTERSGIDALSDRELQIFELIGQGHSTSEIAKLLHLSVHTIETHREKIRTKLGLRNGTELMLRAVQWQVHRGEGGEPAPV